MEFLKKYWTLIFVIGAIIGLVWTVNTKGADGSWLAIVVPGGIFLLIGIINKRRGLPWFSNSSGGH